MGVVRHLVFGSVEECVRAATFDDSGADEVGEVPIECDLAECDYYAQTRHGSNLCVKIR